MKQARCRRCYSVNTFQTLRWIGNTRGFARERCRRNGGEVCRKKDLLPRQSREEADINAALFGAIESAASKTTQALCQSSWKSKTRVVIGFPARWVWAVAGVLRRCSAACYVTKCDTLPVWQPSLTRLTDAWWASDRAKDIKESNGLALPQVPFHLESDHEVARCCIACRHARRMRRGSGSAVLRGLLRTPVLLSLLIYLMKWFGQVIVILRKKTLKTSVAKRGN